MNKHCGLHIPVSLLKKKKSDSPTRKETEIYFFILAFGTSGKKLRKMEY